ncbi:MAG: RNA methyltransferase [Thermomicrobiales bacterium]
MREREQLFVVEGLRAIQGLIEHGCRLVYLLIDDERRADVPPSLPEEADRQDARVLAVDPSIFLELSDVETPQPVIGVFRIPHQPLPGRPRKLVALDGIQDPGNMGSILRTCRAAGIDGVLVLRGTVDPYSPKVVRATAGLFASLPLQMLDSIDDIQKQEWALPDQIVIADGNAPTRHTDLDWTVPHILVLGSEGSGTRHQWQSLATASVRIDMEPGVDSLNVAAAAAVLIFEVRRQYALI